MSLLKFAEDFTRLIIRYTRNSSPNNDTLNATMSLTNEQIVYAIHHVLQALVIKGFDKEENDKNNNTLDVFDSVNVISTPDISVAKIQCEQDTENIRRSQESLLPFATDEDSIISDISLKTNKKEENSSDILQNEKKFISQSSPAICINVKRSDTFVCDENGKNTEVQDDVFKSFTNNEIDDLSSERFRVTLSEIRKAAMEFMAKLDRLEELYPQSMRVSKDVTAKIQQAFSVNRQSSPHRTPNKAKIVINRSSTAFPKISTSSKSLATENIPERRKSTGALRANASPVKKSGESTNVRYSSVNLSPCNNTLSGSSTEFRPKFTKNPKYAHVQSTIPKAIKSSQKKMMQ